MGMNRFNAAHPDVDGEDLDSAAAEAAEAEYLRAREARGIEPATGLPLPTFYEETRSLVALSIAHLRWPRDPAGPAITDEERKTAESIASLVWKRGAMDNDHQIRAMLTMLLSDGHITPMGVRQLTRILEQRTSADK